MTKQCDELARLGRAICELRTARSLSEAALAKKAGLTKARLNGIEAGELEANLFELAKLAKALGITTEALVASAGI